MDASTSLVFYENELVGFFTLKPDKIEVEDEEEGIKHVICLEISRIATSSSYQGRGIGTFMLLHIVNLARSVNYRYIVLDALIEKADWYINRNFIPLVESEHIVSNEHGLVYMYRDLYDVELVETFYDELTG
ncbi:hypothetical protein BKP45_14155 [Anaerobacillus alkalidiazotrophicus]|uniref:N-acetyltransferase domain-containing protein n=2 Tax=Anaerobacillus alkalidiazotrophicus TaxID=472963 RepID=A0A1S2M4A5_9BACI|nr:hypothetical protein BKP45_14155 [Anaerobacillus alkalidiazotrophicus]